MKVTVATEDEEVAVRSVTARCCVGPSLSEVARPCAVSDAQDNMQCVVHMRQLRQYSDSAQDYKWWCREVHQTIMWCVVHWPEKQSAVHGSRCVVLQLVMM